MISAPVLLCYTIINLFPILIRSVLFEKTALHNGDCRLTGRFADNHDKPPAVKAIEVNNFQEVKQ